MEKGLVIRRERKALWFVRDGEERKEVVGKAGRDGDVHHAECGYATRLRVMFITIVRYLIGSYYCSASQSAVYSTHRAIDALFF